ncbi:biotin-dependent carboxyltransferase family protein [Pseudomonas sp. R5(2019)]|uniref:5-oxoprolinase subunit C family protein n=1 Tax=Pseudomonas sp. R5(2019) TaxID=2697566 RepID=UPI001412D9ED|nr:biotin-dependent carboxyltransferase family protein [Pseudomonas sp. R5(2019)]NBA94868.1 5-oxoprolinase/urea amidolyase family protein [Pseudomonas sp. R5(2019)]
MIEILSSGALNTVQDAGRPGFLRFGVSTSGAMDRLALACGNALLGNDDALAGLEIVVFPFRLRIHRDCRLALTGADCQAHLDKAELPPDWVFDAKAGQTLVLKAPRRGVRAYLCVAGGIDVPRVMGSQATDLKSGFGGFEGRGLLRGDRLALGASSPTPRPAFGATLGVGPGEPGTPIAIRVMPGAEHSDFEPAARSAFFSQPWTLSPQTNRMGMRLEGPLLHLQQPRELLSHGILPGTVQVPPAGQPIIQLADANTCGGYPKIAHVIDADLWRLAQAPIGSQLRFIEVDHAAALAADRQLEEQLARLRTTSLTFYGACSCQPQP